MVGVVKVNDTFSLHAVELCDKLSKALFLGEIDRRDRLSLTFHHIYCSAHSLTYMLGEMGEIWRMGNMKRTDLFDRSIGICDDNYTRGRGVNIVLEKNTKEISLNYLYKYIVWELETQGDA